MTTYKTHDLPGFEHLLVVGEPTLDKTVEVMTFVKAGDVIGNRELKFNLPEGSMWINMAYLEEVSGSEAEREFASDNPFGAYKYEGRFIKGLIEIVHVVHEDAMTITIIEKNDPKVKGLDKTIYSESFFAMKERALEFIESMLHGNLDAEDMIFELKELKENDYNG